MDYPCAKFGDCSFSRFGSIVQTNRETHTQKHGQTRMNAIFSRLSVSVSKYLVGARDVSRIIDGDPIPVGLYC